MARIPEAEIEGLKIEVSIIRLIEASGVALQKHGKEHAGLCPFHEDSTPSLKVNTEKNVWHCFGCGAGGGVIDWAMKKNGISFRHAVELLRDPPTPSASADTGPAKRSTVRTLPPPVAFDADDKKLLADVIDYYHRCLKQTPDALGYLKKRGIAEAAIDAFKLGYADRTLGLRLPEKNRKEGAVIRGRLQKLGLYRESGHEHFNGSLVIPIMHEHGEVQGVYGRKILDNLRKGTPKHLYLPGPHRGLFNPKALSQPEIIVCEAMIDALTFWSAGYRNVTSAYGVEGFTDEMVAAFEAHQVKRVLIAYDRDAAGDRAAEKLADRLNAENIDPWRIQFPKGMDANEYALQVQPASKALGVLIRKALWLGKGVAPAQPSPAPEGTRTADTDEAEEDRPAPPVSLAADTEAEPLPASPVPPAPQLDIEAEITESEVVIAFGPRRWRIRGLPKNLAVGVLKVNVMVSGGDLFHVDVLDLYQARARQLFTQQAAFELRVNEDMVRGELGRVLLKLEQVQDEAITKAREPVIPALPEMTPEDRDAALAFLKAPDLMQRIKEDFGRCGMVGETTNAFTAYLAAISRKLDAPLGVVVQSSSAAGKSSLMEAVLAMVPDEDKVKYSALTGQSLYYLGETSLKHKVLAIAEEEGASRASYALKLLQSEGELTIASTGADENGNLITQEYRVQGPTALITTTTAIDVDEELMNRCLVLAVDEGREQTRAIHAKQRAKRTLEGLQAKHHKQDILALHRNAQRLLQPLAVVNPFADKLTFLDDRTRMRRDHEKYLTLIDAIALLHQHQRPIKTITEGERMISYVEATAADITEATKLAHEILGRSLDELPPQTRRLLHLIRQMVEERCAAFRCKQSDYRFIRRELRAHTGLSDTQLKVHLSRLTDLELVIAHRGIAGRFEYELVYDGGDDRAPHLSGLIDPQTLAYDKTRSGLNDARSASGRGVDGPLSAPGRSAREPENPRATALTGTSKHLSVALAFPLLAADHAA